MNMRSYALAALLLLSACKPDTVALGQFSGPPPFMPTYPGAYSKALAHEVFFEHPGCEGASYIADEGEAFTYASVRTGDGCREESGAGFGYQVRR